MPVFAYEAVDAKGQSKKGSVEARSREDASELVKKKGLFPTQIQGKGGGAAAVELPREVTTGKKRFGLGSLSQKDLTQFTRQFATLMDAGLPIVRSIDILQRQQKAGLLKSTLLSVKEDVEGGSSLSEAMSRHPRVFDRLYVNMVRAGEASGVLDTILTRLADFREKSMRLRMQVIRAMIYPAAVVVIAGGILFLIITLVIPNFAKMFTEMDIELPLMTQMLIGASDIVMTWWYLFPGIPALLYVAYKLFAMSPTGRYIIDRVQLHLPVFGLVVRKSSVSAFCRTLGTLIASGVPILDALTIIKAATANAVVAQAIGSVHDSIREGDTIAEPLKHSGVFDDIVVNMIDVGEETGELDKMLFKVSDNYDAEIDALVGGLMSLLEPFLIIGMGLTVGFIVIALFLPMIKLMEGISGQTG